MNSTDTTREPAVAGRFYPAEPQQLERLLERLLTPDAVAAAKVGTAAARPALLAMAPHAGYVYSGRVAGMTYASVAVPRQVLLLGPNHTGLGAARSLWSGGGWNCPLGQVPIARQLLESVRDHAALSDDALAHLHEHSLEVQLPFLMKQRDPVEIVPICLSRLSLGECLDLGEALARAIRSLDESVLIVCSTDMSHYISAAAAERLDRLALERVLQLDAEGLYRTVGEHQISMCGFVPTSVGLVAARALGAERARLIQYSNSGEASGDFARVVGYAGVVVE